MLQYLRPLSAVLVLLGLVTTATAQSLDVTFRYVPQPGDAFVRVFLPGEFNSWGPNSNGRIDTGAPSEMTYDGAIDQWLYTATLEVGQTYQYKVHFHYDESGSEWAWISDPLNDRTNPAEFNNSLVTVEDPMVFQLARRQNEEGEVVEVSAGIFGSEPITTLTFEINGEEQDGLAYFDAERGIFVYELPQPVPKGSQFKLTATDALGRSVTQEVGIIPPQVVEAPRPAGIQDGINYDPANPTAVTLSLFAPYKDYVYVIGDFNEWQVDDDYLMMRDVVSDDSVYYWLTVSDLEPGVEYAFQYLIDGELRLADPYATKVLDPANDPGIEEATYPNLKAYPTGKTDGIVSVLQTGQEPYDWVVEDFEAPEPRELVIYELLLRDFLEEHDYDTLADTLDYLQRLGVNAIELMPINEFEGNLSWGYNTSFYFAPDKYYGPADDLKRLIDEAHQREMAVILDLVLNHSYGQSPLVQLYFSNARPSPENPYYNEEHNFENPDAHWGYDFDHESPSTQYFVDRVIRYWLEEFKVDGFRFDFTKGFTNNFKPASTDPWGSLYDADRVRLLKRMVDAMWEVNPEAYAIFEHLAENKEEKELAEYGILLWGNMNYNYNEATMGYHGNGQSDLSWGYYETRGWSEPNLVTYMESHDEERLMFKNLEYGACSQYPLGGSGCDTDPGTYNVRSLPVALDRMKLAGAFFFTLPGPKMIWQFGELGYEISINYECRLCEKPIKWSEYRFDPLREKLYDTWSTLIWLRREHEVFTSPETEVDLDVRGSVKTIRLSHPSMTVYIIGNFGVEPTEAISFDFQSEGTWYEYFSREVRSSAQDDAVSLLPGEVRLYTTQELPAPEPELITVDAEDDPGVPEIFRLEQNYPNPFNPATVIRYALPQAGPVRLDVFDVLGRRVATLVDGFRSAGTHAVTFEANGLPGGTYLYRLVAGTRVEVRKMQLVK